MKPMTADNIREQIREAIRKESGWSDQDARDRHATNAVMEIVNPLCEQLEEAREQLASISGYMSTNSQDLIKEILGLRRNLADAEWVSVDDRVPTSDTPVITAGKCGVHGDSYFDGKAGWANHKGMRINYVTHWMLLPEPPK